MTGNGWDRPEVLAARLTELKGSIQALTTKIDEMTAWTRSHEQDEFSYHGRVEEHMLLTREFIAGSNAVRRGEEARLNHLEAAHSVLSEAIRIQEKDLSRQVDAVESALTARLGSIANRLWWIMGGLAVIAVVVVPLCGWLLVSVHELDVQVHTNTERIHGIHGTFPGGPKP